MTAMYEPVHHIQEVEDPSSEEQPARSAYKHGSRALAIAVLLGVVGTVAVLATRNATTQQKTTPFDADALTTLLSEKGDCKDSQMDKVKGAIEAVKLDLSRGVMIKNDKLWKKYFGEEPKEPTKEHVKDKHGKDKVQVTWHVDEDFSDDRVAKTLRESVYKLVNYREEKEPLDGKENGKWVARCCNHENSYHCKGVCKNNYFYVWGKLYDYPGAVHICQHAWDLDPVVFGAGLFHSTVHITGAGRGSTNHPFDHAEHLAKVAPGVARNTANNYMLYAAENGLSHEDFAKLKSQWWKLLVMA